MRSTVLNLLSYFFISAFPSHQAFAQVQVSREPYHHLAMENQYLRLLDVVIKPGDTSLFHIHSTPSLFLHLSNTSVASQVNGEDWQTARNTVGNTWYRSFSPEVLIHRVANIDTTPMHVIDIEILSAFDTTAGKPFEPMPLPVTFENKQACVYTANDKSLKDKKLTSRGPLVAIVVTGENVVAYTPHEKRMTKLDPGEYIYIRPGTDFQFRGVSSHDVKVMLFEIK